MASGDVPIRSISAPAKLESSTLFAYPVIPMQSEYALVFSPHRFHAPLGVHCTAETLFNQRFEECITTGSTSRRESFSSDSEVEAQTCARSTKMLVKNVIEKCILEDDPQCAPEHLVAWQLSEETRELLSQAYELAKDQVGCRFLQKKLEDYGPALTDAVFAQVFPHMPELMVHPFGNYLCQKLIEAGSERQLEMLLEAISPQLMTIAVNTHGTRVVQKVIEQVSCTPLAVLLLTPLRECVVTLSRDVNGNHVVQRCLSCMPPELNQFVYDAACDYTVEMATHRHGCCVLQRCVDYANQKQFDALTAAVVRSAVALVQDAFGNYAVQYILDRNVPAVNCQLANTLLPHILSLSKQKFASNVIEKCLLQNDPETQQRMIKEIAQSVNVGEMLADQYANYVVQRALSLANPQLLQKLLGVRAMQLIRPSLDSLRNSQLGMRVFTKLVKKYPALGDRSRRAFAVAS